MMLRPMRGRLAGRAGGRTFDQLVSRVGWESGLI